MGSSEDRSMTKLFSELKLITDNLLSIYDRTAMPSVVKTESELNQ